MNHNQKIGAFGEQLAAQFLIKRGYKILNRNLKTSFKELDIVAFLDGLLVFVEVKTRTNNKLGLAEDMLSSKKIYNFKQAVNIYLNTKKTRHNNIRFDFIAVDLNIVSKIAKIKHFKDMV